MIKSILGVGHVWSIGARWFLLARRPLAVRIRDATNSDLPRILEIERLCFSQPWSFNAFKRELSLPFSRILVAVNEQGDGPRIDGFLCRWLVTDELHILNVAVHPDARRSGVGTRLMAEAIDEAKQKGAKLVTLEVRRSNLAARSLYRKFAFEERRLRRDYYGRGEDALIMELALNDDHGIK